jgi:nicotinamidase-related amidase
MVISVPCRHKLEFVFSAEHTALLVIDMQRDFLDESLEYNNSPEPYGGLRRVIPGVSQVVARCRDMGLEIIHTREGYSPDMHDVHALKRSRKSTGLPGPFGLFLIRGEAGHDFYPGFEPQKDELVIDKAGFSSFYQTGLDDYLKKAGITHLIIVGITTQCCVLSTIRSAVDRGYYCLLVEDCCAAINPRDHVAAIQTIEAEENLFGWISTKESLITAMRAQ